MSIQKENETMNPSTVFTMFEDVMDSQAKQMEAIQAIRETLAAPPPVPVAAPSAPVSVSASLNSEDRAAIRSLSAKFDRHGEKMEALAPRLADNTRSVEALAPKLDDLGEKVSRPQTLRHVIDFMGNWALIALVFFIVAFGISLYVICKQWDFRDNDLKFRYIKMRGEATPGEIERLETIFDYERNTDSIRNIRHRVEQYERLVKETAEKSERARLNATEAERLQNQAEKVKRKK